MHPWPIDAQNRQQLELKGSCATIAAPRRGAGRAVYDRVGRASAASA